MFEIVEGRVLEARKKRLAKRKKEFGRALEPDIGFL